MSSLYVIQQIGPEVADRDEKISELWGLEERTLTREQVQALLDGKKFISIACVSIWFQSLWRSSNGIFCI